MIRYVLLGAVVGFAVAYFLLSSGSKDLTAPPPDAPSRMAVPARPNPAELMRMEPLPDNMARRGMPLDADAGPR